jgi:hypothetical protein
MLCSTPCIRHGHLPKEKTVPDDLLYVGHRTESRLAEFLFLALLSHVCEGFLSADHRFASAHRRDILSAHTEVGRYCCDRAERSTEGGSSALRPG